ncbi:MAG: hypothetical protein A2X94_08980 [Bdellovibrionales bacterium GWB1_55_8]|nr:MAG: hypothetical protein A2X94_08980 [Bdellovibrionales bacterium GWB1_55_8]
MLNIIKEQKGAALVVQFIGAVDESADLPKLLGPPPSELVINTRQVTRINSNGVKQWIRYMQQAKDNGTKLHFVECAVPIVQQINFIQNFTAGGAVESVFVPFACTQCKKELVGLFTTEALRKANAKLPSLKCSACGGAVEFDDIPEEYFGFLSRS